MRSQAREIKFLIPHELAPDIRQWARLAMPADRHVQAGAGVKDQYRVTSVYFDTQEWDVFRKNGSYRRSKYRVRRYGEEEQAFLERKIKTCGQISKWRSPVSLPELNGLTLPPRDVRRGEWFCRRIRLRGLQPVCRISYRRMARVNEGRFGRFRLTLDEAIFGEAVRFTSFSRPAENAIPVDCCPDGIILELKFSEIMPVLFKRLIEDFRLGEGSFSKYRSAVEKLGLIPDTLATHA